MIVRNVTLAALVAVLALTGVGPRAALGGGVTYNVTRTDDPAPDGCQPGDCSIREAAIAANESPGEDEIQLAAATYTLSIGTGEPFGTDATEGDIEITDDLTVRGANGVAAAGQNGSLTTIDAAGVDRIFEVLSVGTPVAIELVALELRGGSTAGSGGAVLANGAFSLGQIDVAIDAFQQ